MTTLPPHFLLVDPIRDPQTTEGGIHLPQTVQRVYVNLGWVEEVSHRLHEDIEVGDLLVFLPWTGKNVPTGPLSHKHRDKYVLHESDCLLVIESW